MQMYMLTIKFCTVLYAVDNYACTLHICREGLTFIMQQHYFIPSFYRCARSIIPHELVHVHNLSCGITMG